MFFPSLLSLSTVNFDVFFHHCCHFPLSYCHFLLSICHFSVSFLTLLPTHSPVFESATTTNELTSLLDRFPVTFLYLHAHPTTHSDPDRLASVDDAFQSLHSIAQSYFSACAFLLISDDDVIKNGVGHVGALPALYVWRDGDFARYFGKFDDVSIWVKENRFPLVAKVDSGNAPNLIVEGRTTALLLVDPAMPDARDMMYV